MKRETLILIGKGVLVLMAAFVPFLLLYLVGSFIAFTWDAGQWAAEGRSIVGMFGLIIGLVSGGLSAIALYIPRCVKS